MIPEPRPQTVRRAGFTLVELLVVILILAILIALLVPAITAAVRAANDARVAAEINNLATSLAKFKADYGDLPPSRIILPANGDWSTIPTTGMVYGSTSDISYNDLKARTLRYLQKFFPRTPIANFNPGANTVILQGHECLVFFLGGVPLYDATTQTYSMKGFSKDPTNPFSVTGTNRTQPYYEFPSARLVDVYSTPISATGTYTNGFPSFVDPLGSENEARPYSYFSAYGGNGYDPNDDNSMGLGMRNGTTVITDTQEMDESQSSLVFRNFRTIFPPNNVVSYGPNPYTSTDPTSATTTYINPQSFQLISAGRDRMFGLGGAYTPNSTTDKLPVSAAEANLVPIRGRERDNITNFSSGKLD